ncbi:threonine ammonia-lyase [Fodinicola acaciae]|uniref:threonine ammonia-lyase n=1 Tax=Fodinicola acaciae TaxID=2681555 RepID=UPI0013D1D978|nr:pyridoxal-phosphate dependent enzyme [Fodinicola acaciae]
MAVREVRIPTAEDAVAARQAVSLPPTPVDVAPDVVLKLESLQPTGSFKVRGALNALAHAPAGARVVAASAGNHALGIAYAARMLDRAVTVVLPENASAAKVERLRDFGVDLVQVGTSVDEAEAYAVGLDAYYISPYNDPYVIAGQSTIGFELDAQLPGPLTVVCGVGGGGLASGLALWASTRPDVRVVGVEAAVSTAISAAVAAGHQVPVPVGATLADGLAGNIEPGSVTVDVIGRLVSDLVTVTEDELVAGLRHLLFQRGYVAEGAGAVAVAAVLAGKVAAHGRTVAIVSGRNIAPANLTAALRSHGHHGWT